MVRKIEISEETYQKIKDQLLEDSNYQETDSIPDMVGKCYFFRTVTYHLTGRVKKVIGNILELEDAAWIADSGRFMNAIKEGTLSEVEPVGIAYLNLQTVTDFFPWRHELPIKQQ